MGTSCEVVGVVGAGAIGTGVAESLAASGHQVVLVDVSQDQLQLARRRLLDHIRARRLLGKRGDAEPPEVVLERVALTTSYVALERASFVVENIVERWDLKRPVYERLDAVCVATCILAANTSAIPITHIAAATNRAARVIGVHFMNPVPSKQTVEIIRGYHTSQETLERTQALLGRMGKQGIVVEDGPGFVSNRILMLTINEAILTLQDGVASAVDVDRICRECFGHAMGPLETADLIGLDNVLDTLDVLWDFTRDAKFRPSSLLRKLVDAGLHGRKSGEGFFRYG